MVFCFTLILLTASIFARSVPVGGLFLNPVTAVQIQKERQGIGIAETGRLEFVQLADKTVLLISHHNHVSTFIS
jgi:hypothetical protein